jgi:hypothetical protein
MTAITKLANSINNALNGFLVPEYVGFAAKLKRVGVLEPDICTHEMFNGGHFETQDHSENIKISAWQLPPHPSTPPTQEH